MVDGLVFTQKASAVGGAPTRVEDARIALVQFHISPPKSDLDMNVVVSDYKDMDRILKEERNYILKMVKAIKATGCNVLLIQKSILRDAVSDLALHYMAKAKIMVIKDIEREDVAFISKTLGVAPVAHVDSLKPERLASAALVHEVSLDAGKVVKVVGIQKQVWCCASTVRVGSFGRAWCSTGLLIYTQRVAVLTRTHPNSLARRGSRVSRAAPPRCCCGAPTSSCWTRRTGRCTTRCAWCGRLSTSATSSPAGRPPRSRCRCGCQSGRRRCRAWRACACGRSRRPSRSSPTPWRRTRGWTPSTS